MTVAWNPSDKDASLTLSGSNLTVTSTSSSFVQVRSDLGYVGGSGGTASNYILYFECDFTNTQGSGGVTGVGVSSNPGEPTNQFLGETNHGVGYYTNSHVAYDDATAVAFTTYVAPTTVGVIVDFFNQKVWWTLDGTTFNDDVIGNQNPITNTGGFNGWHPTAGGLFGDPGNGWHNVFAAFSTLSSGCVATANFGASAFTYATLFSNICGIGGTAWDGTTNNASLAPSGIAAADALGTPVITGGGAVLSVTGIAAADALGTPTFTGGGAQISPSGIPAADALGTTHISSGSQTISPTGIAAADALGSPHVGAVIVASGINAGIVLQSPSISTGGGLAPSGIAAIDALGTPTLNAGAKAGVPIFHGPF